MTTLCECGCGQPTSLHKQDRPAQGHVKGQPARFIHGHNGRLHKRSLEDKFWEKVVKGGPDECWEWQGARDPNGYGRLADWPDRSILAHRVSWELNCGDPKGLCVLHRCDNPPCVNPAHLFLGTQTDNIRDMRRKGRAFAKLTEDDVREIRKRYEAGESTQQLADSFGVRRGNIGFIVKHETWKNVA